MREATLYQRNKEVILNRAKRYYRDNIEESRVKARISIENYLKKKKDIKREYRRNRYNNMSKEDKQ